MQPHFELNRPQAEARTDVARSRRRIGLRRFNASGRRGRPLQPRLATLRVDRENVVRRARDLAYSWAPERPGINRRTSVLKTSDTPQRDTRFDLTGRQIYLYDTLGHLHLRGVLTAQEVEAFAGFFLRAAPDASNATLRTDRWTDLLSRGDMFRTFARDPRIVRPILNLINQPMRLVETYGHRSGAGSFLYMHNGNTQDLVYPDGVRATKNMAYRCEYHDGRLYTTYVKAIVYLTDIDAEGGPFCYVEGSHKANFAFPWPKGADGEPILLAESDFPSLRTVPVAAGDVILLNEALLHGAMPKRSAQPRILMSYSFCPAFMADWRPLQRPSDDLTTAGYYDLDDESDFFEGR
jgi:hypothetical protein